MKHWINKWFLEHQCDASTSLSKKKKENPSCRSRWVVGGLLGSGPPPPVAALFFLASPLLSLPLLASFLSVLGACATAVPDLVLSLSELRRSVEEEWM